MRPREYVTGSLKDYGLSAARIRARIPVSRMTPYNWNRAKKIPTYVLDELGIPYLPENVKRTPRGGFAVPDGYVLKKQPTTIQDEVESTPVESTPVPALPEQKIPLSALLRAISDQVTERDEQIQRLLEDRDRLSSSVEELQRQVKMLMELVESATAPLPPSPPPLPDPAPVSDPPETQSYPWARLQHVRVRHSIERGLKSFAKHEQDRIIKKILEFDDARSRKSQDVRWPEGGRFRTPGDSREKCTYRVSREIRLVFAYDKTETGSRYELLDVVRRNDKRYYSGER